ncbi:MAG: glutamine synthetase, partial [Propionibacteriaceae bacterium]|nr:glutamine synthetase [Propionibacteriaceae bacterium]
DSSQSAWNAINSPYDPQNRNRGYKVPAHGGYHIDLPNDCSYGLRNQIVRTLEDHGIPIKYHHSENGGPGQVEIEIEFATLTEVADRSQKIKYIVKNLAHQGGKTATFMPKPFFGEAGNGMHVHMHMFKDGRPIFYDADGYSGLSATGLAAIAGILTHARALNAIACPSTNSYKRLVPGYEAPVTICYATANRSSVIRIPGYARAPMEKRFEYRPSDATANPYLLFSALTMAAIDGIQRGHDPVALGFGPYDRNMYYLTAEEKQTISQLPKSLDEAADALEADYQFLLNGGVFPEALILNHLKKIRADATEVSLIPHPVEFQKYFEA